MRTYIIIILILLSIISCNQEKPIDTRNTKPGSTELKEKLQTIIDTCIDMDGEDPIYNDVLLVECPGFKWKGAAGLADGKSEVMTTDHKIKIASIGKTFTATIVLQLMEEGYLNLSDLIEKYLDNRIIKLDSLDIYKGVTYGRQITIEQLLSHTSGIADYMEDPGFIPDVIEHPKTLYNPSKILEKYYEYQTNHKAAFPPGEGFNYSDVNYVLLAMIIENVTGSSLQVQLRKRIFDPLGMGNSYLEYYEAARGDKPLSHAWFSTFDLVTDVNTSFDWGGGGIVSTCEELNTFFRALLKGRLFKKQSTLKKMLEAADRGLGGSEYDYGLGIMKRNIHGLTFYGHGGAYDCDAFYCPEQDISVCMSLNQMNTHGKRDKLFEDVVKLIM
jgi:D-alanyl-D-alanine carboxypeptidase